MTVNELIAKLQAMPGDAPVMISEEYAPALVSGLYSREISENEAQRAEDCEDLAGITVCMLYSTSK